MNTAYQSLERHFARLSSLSDALGILCWDKEVTMPHGAANRRGENLAILEGLRHEILTAPEMADLLARADAGDDVWRKANLAQMRRIHTHATALPGDLVEACTQATTRSEMAWREARRDNDFAGFLPYLTEVLNLTRQVADAKAGALGVTPYDALLDSFDPGTRQTDIDPILHLRAELPDLIAAVLEKQASLPSSKPLQGPFPVPQQEALGRKLMQQLGFDMTRGRLDVSTHPFCGGATHDVRLTTRYEEADFIPAMMGVLHETGHALYEQGLPEEWISQPVGQAAGMTVHESQSLMVEMQVCRSQAFVNWVAPLLRQSFDASETDAAWQPDNLHRLLTHVQPGLIRVDSDEVTYPAHILVRYEIEKALISGDLALKDLPGAFNDGIHALLGLNVPDDRRGCLQDIHWPEGLFGYFPCYALGALASAQLRAAAYQQDATIAPAIGEGNFAPLMQWLRTNVHQRASSASMPDIIRSATGASLGADAYLSHIRRRYLDRAPDA